MKKKGFNIIYGIMIKELLLLLSTTTFLRVCFKYYSLIFFMVSSTYFMNNSIYVIKDRHNFRACLLLMYFNTMNTDFFLLSFNKFLIILPIKLCCF